MLFEHRFSTGLLDIWLLFSWQFYFCIHVLSIANYQWLFYSIAFLSHHWEHLSQNTLCGAPYTNQTETILPAVHFVSVWPWPFPPPFLQGSQSSVHGFISFLNYNHISHSLFWKEIVRTYLQPANTHSHMHTQNTVVLLGWRCQFIMAFQFVHVCLCVIIGQSYIVPPPFSILLIGHQNKMAKIEKKGEETDIIFSHIHHSV